MGKRGSRAGVSAQSGMEGWAIKIVGHDVRPASWFVANEKNIRIHPRVQVEATEGSLDELGWVKSVTVNVRGEESWGERRHIGTVIDGHARIMLALRRGEETLVPVEYVDLEEGAEEVFLSLVDEIGTLALRDLVKARELRAPRRAGLRAFVEGLTGVVDEGSRSGGQRCPNCGHRWGGRRESRDHDD